VLSSCRFGSLGLSLGLGLSGGGGLVGGEVGGCEGVGSGLGGAGVAVDPRRGKISYWELSNSEVVGEPTLRIPASAFRAGRLLGY